MPSTACVCWRTCNANVSTYGGWGLPAQYLLRSTCCPKAGAATSKSMNARFLTAALGPSITAAAADHVSVTRRLGSIVRAFMKCAAAQTQVRLICRHLDYLLVHP